MITATTSQQVTKAKQQEPPIAVFDSGVGGLSILQCIAQQLPAENLYYVADTINAPYGEQTTEFIQQRLLAISQWLIKQNIKAMVIACNTATVNAIDFLRKHIPIPIIGVEPAIKPAVKISQNKRVALMVTKATSQNARFLKLIDQHKHNAQVFIQPCPGLVDLIEQGQQAKPQCQQLLKHYLQLIINNKVDTLVLGCTHYPLVLPEIMAICGNNIKVMETAKPVTEQLKRQLISHQLLASNHLTGHVSFYSSNGNDAQQVLFEQIWTKPVKLSTIPQNI